MFKFSFRKNESEAQNYEEKKTYLNWIPATKVESSLLASKQNYHESDYTETEILPEIQFKLIRSERVLSDLKRENKSWIIEAESQHSDLIPAKYEGGLKIWECSYDVGRYMFHSNLDLKAKQVLDLGCGAGIIGLLCLLEGSNVHFQDYNIEVIESVTIPNVLLNFDNHEDILKRCSFFSGDWSSFTTLSSNAESHGMKEYDFIFTSETIYNSDNHSKLYEVFKQRLKDTGIGYVAGKVHYFGVGGGMRQFETLVKNDGCFKTETVWKSQEGLQREILRLERLQSS